MNSTATESVLCPKCKGPMVLRNGKNGPFYGCSIFPKCKGIKSYKSGVSWKKTSISAVDRVRPTFKGTDQQEAIWSEVLSNSYRNVLVQALAGCGKSSTASSVMWSILDRQPDASVLYLAFNKAIVEDFEGKCPIDAMVKTFNQMGHRVCSSTGYVKFSNSKFYKVLEAIWTPSTTAQIESEKIITSTIKNLVNMSKAHNFDGRDTNELLALSVKFDIAIPADFTELVLEIVPQVIADSGKLIKSIDFSDQLWLPIHQNYEFPTFDYIVVDEAQDLNAIQHLMIEKMCHASTKVIIIGDRNQAIYGWRGADMESMDNLSELLGDFVELPLTNSFRCAKSIARLAQEYVSDFETLSDSEGLVQTGAVDIDTYAGGDMVVCRMNAPLLRLAFQLLRNGQRVKIQGRDFGQSILALIDSFHVFDFSKLIPAVDKWATEETIKLKDTRNADTKIEAINDKRDTVILLTTGVNDMKELRLRIKSLFSDDGTSDNVVLLSTIHRCKGLEAQRVFWLDYNIDLSGMISQEDMLKQEDNLRYVAITRAIEELYLIPKPVLKR